MSKQYKDKNEDIKFTPPNNEHLLQQAESQEPRLLALCIRDRKRLEECVRRGVALNSFMIPRYRAIYGILAKHFDNYGTTMTRSAYEDEVKRIYPEEEQAAKRSEYDDLWSYIVDDSDFAPVMNDIEGRYLQNQAYSIFQAFFDKLLNQTSDQKKTVEDFQRAAANIKQHKEFAWTITSSLADNMAEVKRELMSRRDDPTQFHGVNTGFRCMDQVFNGLGKGKYAVVLAMEGGGKSTFMFNIAHNMCMAGLNVAYVTVESDTCTTSKRLMTIHSRVNYNRISLGGSGENGLNDYTMEQLDKAIDDFTGEMGNRFHWIKALQGTAQSVIIEDLNKKMTYTKIDVIFIDYLDVIGSDTRRPDRPDLELADVSAGFQNFGTVNNILVITAQQMKTDKVREMTGKGGNPKTKVTGDNFNVGVGDVAGSKKISGAADYIFALFVDPNSPGRMYVQTVKARNARTSDKFALAYDRDSGKLEDILPDASGYESIVDDISNSPIFKKAIFEQPVDMDQDELSPVPRMISLGYITEGTNQDTAGWALIESGVDFFKGE